MHLCQRRLVRLRGLQIGVIGRGSELLAELPSEHGLDARTAAGLVAIGGAEQKGVEVEHVDDFIMQPLTISRKRGPHRPSRVAHPQLESARALRFKRWISKKIVWEEAVEVEEGRLGDSFAVRSGDRETGTKVCQKRRPQARR